MGELGEEKERTKWEGIEEGENRNERRKKRTKWESKEKVIKMREYGEKRVRSKLVTKEEKDE